MAIVKWNQKSECLSPVDAIPEVNLSEELEKSVLERCLELNRTSRELEAANKELKEEIKKHEQLETELVLAREIAESKAQAKSSFKVWRGFAHRFRTEDRGRSRASFCSSRYGHWHP